MSRFVAFASFIAVRPRLAGIAVAGLLIGAIAVSGNPARAGELLSGQNIGLVGGAVGGGLIGNKLGGEKHKLLGTAAGVLGGGAVGGVVGNMIDNRKPAQPAAPVRRADPVTTGSIGDKAKSLVNGQNIGIAAGAVGGGVLGNKLSGKNKVLGTLGGAVGGGAVGGIVGNYIDKR